VLNKKPIFIVGFQHGGSNIVLNLLRSHPEICSPRGETQEVFMGKGFPRRFREPWPVVLSKLWHYLPILLQQQQNVFSIDLWEARKPFTARTIELVDRVLHEEKFLARGDTQNRYRSEDVEYTDVQIAESRTLCKNLNGLIFLTEELSRMYPDATFIALVRNGYALCEGHMRRGVPLEKIARNYQRGCQKIIELSKTLPNFHVFKFEDLMASPRQVFAEIFSAAGLQVSEIDKVRLENKKIIGKDGSHTYMYEQNPEGIVWYPVENFMDHFKGDVNKNQIENLKQGEKDTIKKFTEPSLNYFGYTA
jgi:hypothetical protein